MGYNIVTLNVSVQVASAPSLLQQTGALISTGGTTLTAGTKSLLTQLSDLTPLLATPLAITSISWASSVATVTTAAPHGYATSTTFPVVISGAAPTGYNGSFTATATGTSTFTYPLVTNPGSETTAGYYSSPSIVELQNMATTFFAQGNTASVYVLELGNLEPAAGITALHTWITANPGVFYAYLFPQEWDNASGLMAFLALYTSLTSSTYFFITSTLGTYTDYADTLKDVFLVIEAPAAPTTEFTAAAPFYSFINRNPSALNKLTPTAFNYEFAVTPYPTFGNAALLQTLKTADVNIIGTGAAGGISNLILLFGTTMDGNDLSYWYAVDWMQIQCSLALTAAVYNGNNNPQNPLVYNQDGINQLVAVLETIGAQATSFGVALAPVTVTAIPFNTYIAANPENYQNGIYGGLSIEFTPQLGFKSIILNMLVNDIPTGS